MSISSTGCLPLLDTSEVLEAAGTKWNILKFKPGLVGGHCIGVDPYYLTHRAAMTQSLCRAVPLLMSRQTSMLNC